MNYRHIYHAGNFADVIKHCIFICLIDYLAQKPKPFCVLDTHAGIGLYPIDSIESQKTQEFHNGFLALLQAGQGNIPVLIQEYLHIIQEYYKTENRNYPGSPIIALQRLRNIDNLIVCELHPEDVQCLKRNVRSYSNAAVHHTNGYEALKAFLPPKQSRGLVLIDPPFEKTTEFNDIVKYLKMALKAWRGGSYMIWYPVKDKRRVEQFENKLIELNFPLLITTISQLEPQTETGMHSCAVAIINPAWTLEKALKQDLLPYLAEVLQLSWSVNSYHIV